MQRKIDTLSGVRIKHKIGKWVNALFPISAIFFIVLGIYQIIDDSFWLGIAHLFFGVINGVYPLIEAKTELVVFEKEGISYRSQRIFPKQKFLAYKDISEAKYILGDFVFRNKNHEIRLIKEFLNEEDIKFLQEKIADLNAFYISSNSA